YLRSSKLCMVDTCRLAIRLEVEFLRVGVASSVPANNGSLISKNPCTQAGNAPDPSVYQQKGQTAQNNAVADIYYLFQFRAGGGLDAQPQGASPAYANYAYGMYINAAGYTLNQALSGADIYAEYRAHYPVTVPMARPDYPFTPVANVRNITNGFNAQQTGTVCHKERRTLRDVRTTGASSV